MKPLRARLPLFLGFIALQFAALQGRAASVSVCDEAGLRAAIAGGGTVTFACDGVIRLSNPLVVTTNLTLDATGRQVVLDGGTSNRLFEVASTASLFLNHISLVKGAGANGGAVYNLGTFEAVDCTFASNSVLGYISGTNNFIALGEGGAIWNGGSLALRRCVLNGNRADGPAYDRPVDRSGSGGAICNRGQLFASDCLFVTNTARGGDGILVIPVFPFTPFPVSGNDGRGGALFNVQTAIVLNCTFVGNTASGGSGSTASGTPRVVGGAGGSALGGAICGETTTLLTNCSFYGNQSMAGAGGAAGGGAPAGLPGQGVGGGVACDAGTTVVALCTLVSNSATLGGALSARDNSSFKLFQSIAAYSPLGANASGQIEDLGYNLCSDVSLVLTNTGSIANVNPMLGPLADNGGPTPTIALQPGSPAIDSGSVAVGVGTDQRGFSRPAGSRSDIGAVETTAHFPAFTLGFTPGSTPVHGTVYLTIVVSNSDIAALTGLRLTNTLSSELSIAIAPVTTVGFNGIVKAVTGTRTIVLSGFSLAPQASSTIRVPVAADLVGIGSALLTAFQSDQLGRQSPGNTASVMVGGAPDGHTDIASGIDFTSATLHGTINPGGATTMAWFEYGTTANFGLVTPVQNVSPGFTGVSLSAFVGGLPSSTEFFYRVAASNQFGNFRGEPISFFTVPVCDEAHLRADLARGGIVRLECNGTIVLSNTISITTDTVLDAGNHDVTLSGNNAVRVLQISPGVSMTLRHVTVANGRSTNGGGIYNEGTLFLDECVLTGNQCAGLPGARGSNGPSATPHPPAPPADGQPGGTGGFGGGASGGGLYNAGTCLATRTSFSSNSTVAGTGGRGGDAGSPNYTPGNLVPGGFGGVGGMGRGGAVFNAGNLILSNCSLHGNLATGGRGGDGGYYYPHFSESSRGGAGAGGVGSGAAISSEGTLTLINTTIANNEAAGGDHGTNYGIGGDAFGGGVSAVGSIALTNCTVAANHVRGGEGSINFSMSLSNGSSLGAGIAISGGTATLKNTLLANNGPSGSNCFGAIVDAGHNLSSDNSAHFTQVSSLSNVDPGIGTLSDAGGPTLSIPLLGSSPAIDAGDANGCPSVDQRGRPRPALAGCDIGAFEVQPDFWLLSFKRVAGQLWTLRSIGPPGATLRIQTSADLIQWTSSGSQAAGTDGVFESQLTIGNSRAQFFRIATP